MTIKGIKLRFDCADGEQYETIGAFWDAMRTLCPGMELNGVGFGWENDTLSYLIGTENGVPDIVEKLRERFPGAVHTEMELPNNGWKTYTATANTLDALYAEIYRDGPLDYEIERFDAEGNAVIEIHRME